jgi:hypothetical protein
MSKIDHYVRFNQDGTVEFVTETRSNRNLNEDVISKIGSGAVRHVRKAFMHDGSPVGLLVSAAETWGYKFMPNLKINCMFRIMGDKTLRPIYMHNDEKSSKVAEYPQFVADWVVPPSMRLMFASRIKMNPEPYCEYKNSCLLIAWDPSSKRAHRLPLPNLYDNCYMCMGEYNGRGASMEEAFGKAADQLDKSEWNSDLVTDSRIQGSDEMFQFKPSAEGTAMESIPFTRRWQDYCPVAGNVNIEILSGAL